VVWIERQKKRSTIFQHTVFLDSPSSQLEIGKVFPQSLARFMTSNETCS
jgi:hypothetical protein